MDLNGHSKEHQNNPIIGYLHINSLRDKINDLREICTKTQIQVLTKPNSMNRSQMIKLLGLPVSCF